VFHYLFHQYSKKWWAWSFALIVLLAGIVICYIKAQRITETVTDLSVYFFSGWFFTEGMPLYDQYYKTVPPYLYLPFMAMLFTPLNLAKPETSAFIFNLLNLILIFLVFNTLFHLLSKKNTEKQKILFLLFLVLIFSARYLWTNFDLGQINLLIVWFILLGYQKMLDNKTVPATVFFTLATGFKIIPVIFLFWFFVRKFSLRHLLISAGIFIILLLLPFPFRGYEQSIRDLHDFYTHVLYTNLLDNQLFYRFTNQSLDAAIGRLFLPSVGDNLHVFPYFPVKPDIVPMIALSTKILISIPFLLFIFRQIKSNKILSFFELSLVFLFMHIISSITWKNHLVSMTVILIPLFYLMLFNKKLVNIWFLIIILLLMTILSMSGTSLVGLKIAQIVGSYSLYTLLLLSLYFYYLYLHFLRPQSFSAC